MMNKRRTLSHTRRGRNSYRKKRAGRFSQNGNKYQESFNDFEYQMPQVA